MRATCICTHRHARPCPGNRIIFFPFKYYFQYIKSNSPPHSRPEFTIRPTDVVYRLLYDRIAYRKPCHIIYLIFASLRLSSESRLFRFRVHCAHMTNEKSYFSRDPVANGMPAVRWQIVYFNDGNSFTRLFVLRNKSPVA